MYEHVLRCSLESPMYKGWAELLFCTLSEVCRVHCRRAGLTANLPRAAQSALCAIISEQLGTKAYLLVKAQGSRCSFHPQADSVTAFVVLVEHIHIHYHTVP